MPQLKQFVPTYLITVNGKELSKHVESKLGRDNYLDVLSVSVTESFNRADSFAFTVVLRGPRVQRGRFAEGSQLAWMDGQLFAEGSEIEIQLGYMEDRSFSFLGEITAVAADFAERAPPMLTVRGFSLYHRLQRKHRRKPFVNVTDSEIAAELARDVGLETETDDSAVRHVLVSPNNATYDAILKDRASRLNYEVAVRGKTLYFQQPRYLVVTTPTVTVEWGHDLLRFSPELSTYNIPTAVTVQGSQTARGGMKKLLTAKVSAGQERGKLGARTGTQLAQQVFGENAVLLNDHNITSQQEARELAQAHLEAKALEFMRGRGECIGNPKLTARSVIEITGLGNRFSGNYYVVSSKHSIDANGYRTCFEVKRNANDDA